MARAERLTADRLFLFAIFALAILGLIILTSASAPLGFSRFGDSYFFIKKQILLGFLPGLLLFFLFSHLHYDTWRRLRWPIYILALILLILVFVPGIGMTINGARSWLSIFNNTFQPAEFAKLAIIFMAAALLSDPKTDLRDWKTGILPILAVLAPAVILVGLQPDVGTLTVFAVIIFALMYIGGVPRVVLVILGLAAAAGFLLLLLLAPYRAERLTTFLHPELDPKGVGYQTNQAFLAIGSGGLWGLGLGHSRQKFQYLPEVHADSIFAVIGEEMGFIFTVLFVFLIAFVGLRGLKIAKKAPDGFGRLLVSGVMVWFMWQSFLNIGGIMGFLPLTGVPLPFVSSGGSSLAVALLSVGIVCSVSRNS